VTAASAAPPTTPLPEQLGRFPRLRFMGSKHRLLPWIHEVLSALPFETALDAFSGSGAVAYLLKAMGKAVATNDFLHFPAAIARATIENSRETLSAADLERLLRHDPRHPRFVERTFTGIFYTPADLRFLDRVSWNLRRSRSPHRRALALAALLRACLKRQPRGVFTVAGDPERYKDGRRDLRLSLREHFVEQVRAYNESVFDNGRPQRALCGDVFDVDPAGFDLVYLDPPYVPRSDDNCYVKRYHFLEGLSRYWRGVEILEESRVKKLAKPYTPFSYRRDALAAFERLFARFHRSTLVLSYSTNGYPAREELVAAMERHKTRVRVFERPHRYHFGTHAAVRRSRAQELLIVGD
jgi:adenine-specific DNA-methyltransferase